ncbi:hypothetical protein [Ruegeria meonggei]|uniref:Uncharacterized protein n=1 Tax=Ruegeria meonggei TaxID=1446476 RepID=A0A1X7AEL8_9RHOB|nr:hypothetical protein [Ruegeria meonggei]SLN75825.1 hypothetical protein RUM8411_04269 [Ruegeria meonggei]
MKTYIRQGGGGLLLASFLYLGLPNVLFAVGWLKPPYALGYTIVCLIGLVFLVAGTRRNFTPTSELGRTLGYIVPVCCVLVIWIGFSGIGGIGFQNTDWNAHNSLFKHLIEEDWPLVLGADDPNHEPFFYVYYVAFYLPAALVGKIFGWGAANLVLFLWSTTGVVIAISWFLKVLDLPLTPFRSLLAVLVFIAFGGLDIIGWYLRHENLPNMGEHLEWWAKHFQYSANTTLLVWVPQHTIAAWILTGVTMFHSIFRIPPRSFGLFVAFSLLWTPFAIIGVLPFVVLAIVLWIRENGVRDVFSTSNFVLAPIVGLTSALFLASNTFSFPVSFGWSGRPDFWLFYLVFMGLEVAVFFVPLYWLMKDRGTSYVYTPWLWTSLAVLIVLPFFRMGFANDFVMRGSIPALFVLIIFIAYGLLGTSFKAHPIMKPVLLAVVCVGALTGGSELVRSVKNYTFPPPDSQSVQSFLELQVNHVAQRKGDPDSFFFRQVSRN